MVHYRHYKMAGCVSCGGLVHLSSNDSSLHERQRLRIKDLVHQSSTGAKEKFFFADDDSIYWWQTQKTKAINKTLLLSRVLGRG